MVAASTPRGTAITMDSTKEMPPMMTDRPMTSVNFWVAGTFHFQLSPKLPTTALLSQVKKPGIMSRSSRRPH
mgnify:CR=1 FL=1